MGSRGGGVRAAWNGHTTLIDRAEDFEDETYDRELEDADFFNGDGLMDEEDEDFDTDHLDGDDRMDDGDGPWPRRPLPVIEGEGHSGGWGRGARYSIANLLSAQVDSRQPMRPGTSLTAPRIERPAPAPEPRVDVRREDRSSRGKGVGGGRGRLDGRVADHPRDERASGAERRDCYAQPPEDAEDSPQELALKPTLGVHHPRPRRSLQHPPRQPHRRTQHLVIMGLVPHASWMPSQNWG